MKDHTSARISLTCRQAHRLVSEQMDRKLSLVERTRIRFHLLLCIACRTFDQQMHLLRKAMRNFSILDSSASSVAPEAEPDQGLQT